MKTDDLNYSERILQQAKEADRHATRSLVISIVSLVISALVLIIKIINQG